ncbi:MAG: hypothetical protein MZU79_08695 [Anaerotruncus sp.]|nr:hypothetical protein [Anaerotruncus sp.]
MNGLQAPLGLERAAGSILLLSTGVHPGETGDVPVSRERQSTPAGPLSPSERSGRFGVGGCDLEGADRNVIHSDTHSMTFLELCGQAGDHHFSAAGCRHG